MTTKSTRKQLEDLTNENVRLRGEIEDLVQEKLKQAVSIRRLQIETSHQKILIGQYNHRTHMLETDLAGMETLLRFWQQKYDVLNKLLSKRNDKRAENDPAFAAIRDMLRRHLASGIPFGELQINTELYKDVPYADLVRIADEFGLSLQTNFLTKKDEPSQSYKTFFFFDKKGKKWEMTGDYEE